MPTIADINVKFGVTGVDNLSKGLNTASKSVGDLGKETDAASRKIATSTANTEKSFSGIKNSLNGISGAIAGAFTVGAILQFGTSIVNTTANFQKMEAVLTNTLGSGSAAQSAMLRIQDIAAKTPFSVEQLTASFVKLANRGIVPTNEEITKLGDLAASTGKDFDMLTEALLDSMTGEFERLKEFGITASAQGDKVAFTFKGVTTEVAKTDAAIKDYVLSLGDAKGVSGSMAAISETLGGKLSNLGDSFTTLFKTIGEGNTSGIFGQFVEGLNRTIRGVTGWIKGSDQAAREMSTSVAANFGTYVASQFKTIEENIKKSGGNLNAARQEFIKKEAGLLNTLLDYNKQVLASQLKAAPNKMDFSKKAGEQRDAIKLTEEKIFSFTEKLKALGAEITKAYNPAPIKTHISALDALKKKQEEIKPLNIDSVSNIKAKFPKVQSQTQFGPTPDSVDPFSLAASDAALTAFSAKIASTAGTVKGQVIEMTNFMQGALTNGFTSFGELLGGILSGQVTGAKGFFNGVLSIVADFAGQLGQYMIATGIAAQAFKNLLLKNPLAAVAAGVVLVGLSGATKGLLAKGPGGSGGSTGGRPSYNSPANNANSAFTGPGANGGASVEFKIKGTELIGVLRNQGLKDGR